MEIFFENLDFLKCKNLNEYGSLNKIAEGRYGKVYKAAEKENPTNVVAIKRIMVERAEEGIPMEALSEIYLLRMMSHKNIINLLKVCQKENDTSEENSRTLYLIMEYFEFDLSVIINHPQVKLQLPDIKFIMHQLLDGICYVHSKDIVHRDLKPANILLDRNGTIKIADFGMSKLIDPESENPMTNPVVTLWYRSPEVLLGDLKYTYKVDMWSLGCIMAELYTRNPILQGCSELAQLRLISCLCGSITANVWPDIVNSVFHKTFILPKDLKNVVRETFPMIKEHAIDLLEALIKINPSERITAEAALNHEFFDTIPVVGSFKDRLTNLEYYHGLL